MKIRDFRKILRRCRENDQAAINWFMENDLELVELLLDVAESAKTHIEEKQLIPGNSYLALSVEELELEEWTETAS